MSRGLMNKSIYLKRALDNSSRWNLSQTCSAALNSLWHFSSESFATLGHAGFICLSINVWFFTFSFYSPGVSYSYVSSIFLELLFLRVRNSNRKNTVTINNKQALWCWKAPGSRPLLSKRPLRVFGLTDNSPEKVTGYRFPGFCSKMSNGEGICCTPHFCILEYWTFSNGQKIIEQMP